MSGYVHGQTRPLADQIARLQQETIRLRQRIDTAQAEADFTAALTIEQANTEAHRIITAAIDAADKIRHQSEQARSAAKVIAENETNRIRERAYLEGRARADTQRIEHDHRMTGNQRRQQLEHALRR